MTNATPSPIADRPEMARTLIDLAERRMRTEGYNAVSFRQLADAVGVKSASVHYHFPTKAMLGEAVVESYVARFMDQLGPADAADESPRDRFERFLEVFRHAIQEEEMICLCAMLGAEIGGLPEPVKAAVSVFFTRAQDWLVAALRGGAIGAEDAVGLAALTLAALEGGMVVAAARGDSDSYALVLESLRSTVGDRLAAE